MTQTVSFPGGVPTWPVLRERLSRHGLAVQLRMIDGQLAFPDEEPSEGWNELRIAVPQGMITLKRQGSELAFVIWGNSDPALVQQWQAVMSACATPP